MTIKNDRFLRALRREPVDQTPIWIMRQAGRYLPEYRATREKAGDFLTLCKTPELACEVTLQPLARFPLDAAILFSDILTIPDAMGLGLSINEGEGPRFAYPIDNLAKIDALTKPRIEETLAYVTDAVTTIKQALNDSVPLIGFAGSPWTLATYMVEGQSKHNFSKVKKLIYSEPAAAHKLLTLLANSTTEYLNAQIAHGVDVVMVFDTWGGVLSKQAYKTFSLAYMQTITSAVKAEHPDIPIVLFTKGGGMWLEDIAATGCDALGLDWSTSISDARERVGDKVALQGNMDPAVLLAPDDRIREEAKQIISNFGPNPGHVFNLGHGITPDINPDKVAVLLDAVQHSSSTR
ncbi:MAG: uroporphyrinogen decarboxylase [Arenicellales bacterium WSBS_2016_MAG_OTU3]